MPLFRTDLPTAVQRIVPSGRIGNSCGINGVAIPAGGTRSRMWCFRVKIAFAQNSAILIESYSFELIQGGLRITDGADVGLLLEMSTMPNIGDPFWVS